ncbi:MAG TPA: GNAT family N-acetyltransferase [Tissierellia bacterium]|nr:GNAT family N-acetyltransferase [Tissierellia bacterium]
MTNIRFYTDRLMVRDMTMADCDIVADSWGSKEVGRYMGDPYYKNGDELRAMFKEDELLKNKQWDVEFYFVTQDKQTGEINGTASTWLMDDGIWGIGYTISYPWWNQGLATELIRGLECFIKSRGGRGMSAEIAKDNTASLKVCNKNGFTKAQDTRFHKSKTTIVFDALELRKFI